MFIASKFEDVHPLKMKIVFEKIGHKKLAIEDIKSLELDVLKVIHYKIATPTILEFLKVYLKQVLGIDHQKNTSLTDEEKASEPQESNSESGKKLLQYRMALYLCKLSVHDYSMSGMKASLIAIGCVYVSLKIVEQLKREQLIQPQIVRRMVEVSNYLESDIIGISQKILYLAQHFDKVFPDLDNLKKSHFVTITKML